MSVRDRENAVPVLLRRYRGRCLGASPIGALQGQSAHISLRFLKSWNFEKQKTTDEIAPILLSACTPRSPRRSRLHDEHATEKQKKENPMSDMNFITPGHVNAFQAIRSQLYDNITLASCRINGEPGVVIVMLDHVGEGKVAVMPLFVAITEGMELEFPGEKKWSWDRQGNPKDEVCDRETRPDAEASSEQHHDSMTLESIVADPWNAVCLDVPEYGGDRLLYAALDASLECLRAAKRNIEAAR
jgi:hypothetical protein